MLIGYREVSLTQWYASAIVRHPFFETMFAKLKALKYHQMNSKQFIYFSFLNLKKFYAAIFS